MSIVIRVRKPGGPSVLVPEDDEVGAPGAGQVRLRQDAIGVNFVDTAFRSGAFKIPTPFIGGVEGAGIVEALGPGVTRVAVGDRVGYFFAPGSYAEVRLVSEDVLVKLPPEVSNEQSAAFLTKGLTAWMAIRALYPVKRQEHVLVQGASGGVGALVARWARSLGATVIGTVGTASKMASTKEYVDRVFLASDPELGQKVRAVVPEGVDAVFEFIGKASFAASVIAVRDGGVIVNIGGASGPADVDKETLSARGVRLIGGSTAQMVTGPTLTVATAELFYALRSGALGEIAYTRNALVDAARVHEDIANRRSVGPQILVP
jgi:NADPH2:quinone reductase